jgi:hypothetical protein
MYQWYSNSNLGKMEKYANGTKWKNMPTVHCGKKKMLGTSGTNGIAPQIFKLGQ